MVWIVGCWMMDCGIESWMMGCDVEGEIVKFLTGEMGLEQKRFVSVDFVNLEMNLYATLHFHLDPCRICLSKKYFLSETLDD